VAEARSLEPSHHRTRVQSALYAGVAPERWCGSCPTR
jgi:hypothetical protein